jgi:hypothetical protein
VISDENMKTLDQEKNMINICVKVSTSKNLDKEKVEVNYEFGFDFINDSSNSKAFVWINDQVAILDDGQYCIFVLESDNTEPFRVRILPDFVNESCDIVTCIDPKVEDCDI